MRNTSPDRAPRTSHKLVGPLGSPGPPMSPRSRTRRTRAGRAGRWRGRVCGWRRSTRPRGGTGTALGLQTSPGKNVLFKGGLQPPGRDPESGGRSRLLGIAPPTATEVLGDGVISRVGGGCGPVIDAESAASWRWPDNAPRGQARRVWRGHRIDPAGIHEQPAGLPVGAG